MHSLMCDGDDVLGKAPAVLLGVGGVLGDVFYVLFMCMSWSMAFRLEMRFIKSYPVLYN
jgi:hypothetical protein